MLNEHTVLSDGQYLFLEPSVLGLNLFSDLFIAVAWYIIISASLFYVLAILSLAIGVVLFIALLPKSISLGSPSELEEANVTLTKALAERHQAIEILARQGQQLRHMASELTMTEDREQRRLPIGIARSSAAKESTSASPGVLVGKL
jgi:CBS domain containing-hemolysin-like protein